MQITPLVAHAACPSVPTTLDIAGVGLGRGSSGWGGAARCARLPVHPHPTERPSRPSWILLVSGSVGGHRGGEVQLAALACPSIPTPLSAPPGPLGYCWCRARSGVIGVGRCSSLRSLAPPSPPH